MQHTNETAQQGGRDLLSNLLSTIATVALIAVTAMQVPDVLIWLAK
ncbi:hypothetical protein PS647_01688 [Pseudomonas fluorescens]|nr:hypothetical protein [Pseudomonas fluorescens]VVM55253.1 hypothetical protein PS647_00997 [Pseudomonas fluorescens]VVM68968.1 hypothetical protein PS647_01688 [Pseudomonas fluorescens]